MTSGSDWAALNSNLEEALRRPNMRGVRQAASALLERLSRRDCISLTAQSVRRTLPLIGRETAAARAAWVLVDLAEALSQVDAYPCGDDPSMDLVVLLDLEEGGAICATGVDQAICCLLFASAARQADSRARHAVDALWSVTSIMSRAALNAAGIHEQVGDYDHVYRHEDGVRRREEWALICALLRDRTGS